MLSRRWIPPTTLAFVVAALAACSPGVSVDSLLANESAEPPRAVALKVQGTWASPAMGTPAMPYTAEYVFDFEGQRAYWKIQPPQMETMVMAYDGETAWGSWMTPAARYTGWMRDMVAEGALEAQLVLTPTGADRSALTLVSAEPEGDPSAWRLTYKPSSGGEWTAWIDDAGLIVALEHEYYFMDGEPMQGRWERSEPKTFGDRTIHSVATYEATRDGEIMERAEETIVEVTWDPELSDDLFAFAGSGVAVGELGTKDVPASTVVSTSHTGPYDGMVTAIERLMDGVMEAGLMPMGPVYGTYLNDPRTTAADQLQTKLSVPVMMLGEPPALGEGLSVEQWPAAQVAYAWHQGDYTAEGEAHARLMTWMGAEGIRPAGPPRALWYHDPEVTRTEDQITEVQIPVSR